MLMAIVSWAQPSKKADEQFDKAAYYEATKLYIKAEPVTKGLDEKARIFYRVWWQIRSKVFSGMKKPSLLNTTRLTPRFITVTE